jgi:myo-inositol-1(or 4)-monophosphatase
MTAGTDETLQPLSDAELAAVERAALDLARAAGAEIVAATTRTIEVAYKTNGKGNSQPTNPVSEIDHQVEAAIRARLAEAFPGHGIIGEEVDHLPAADTEWLWVIDPVDGTTNFVNGFPLFAASIGVLYRGLPVVGATWCSTGHALRPGVYHARRDGPLSFEGEPIDATPRNPGVKRRLAAVPGGSPGQTAQWDNRVTGSAAIESAFVAAGIFNSARFGGLAIWDLASGVTLARAAGHEIWTRHDHQWVPFERFELPLKGKDGREPHLREWSQPLVMGTTDAVHKLLEGQQKKGIVQAAKQLFLRF